MDQKVVITSSHLKKLNLRRKRAINLDLTVNEVRKRNKNSGQPYINAARNPVPGKVPPEGKIFSAGCQKSGCLLNSDAKEVIFRKYYSSGSYNLQTTILISCIIREDPNYQNHDGQLSQRLNTFKYFLLYDGEKLAVCQTTFKNVFKITEKRIRVVQQKLLQDQIFGNDRRGDHKNRPHKFDEYTLESIRNHISSFPTTLSHYKRNVGDPLKEYLPPGLNLNKMHNMYVEANQENIRAAFLEDAYSMELKKSKLRFAKLRSDTCSTCDKLFVAEKNAITEEERRNIKLDIENHHEVANSGYTQMKADVIVARADASVIVLCVDLQQVLFSPTLHHKEMFFMRQFSSYNFCIHNARTEDATMCFWNECLATRGSEEILSCMWRYITENFEPLAQNEIRSLILWSDRCSGQNNNYVTLCFAKLLIQRKYFTSVDQKFLYTGHSFLICDRLFGMIEKQKKICKVYVPADWVGVIEQSRPSHPFKTQVMLREEFLTFDDLLEIVPKPPLLKVSKCHWFRMTADDTSGIYTKENHSQTENYTRHQISHPFVNGIRHDLRAAWDDTWLENVVFRERNPRELPVDAKKYADLQKMLEFLDPEYREFYINLPH